MFSIGNYWMWTFYVVAFIIYVFTGGCFVLFNFHFLCTLRCLFQTEKCGMGVVTDEDINQGDFVIEYVGEGEAFMHLQKL